MSEPESEPDLAPVSGLEDSTGWNLMTPGLIHYKLYEGHPKGSFEEDSASFTEQIIIRASDLMQFVSESLSEYSIYPGSNWYYQPPRSYFGEKGGDSERTNPYLKNMVVKKIDFECFPPGKPCDPLGINSKGEGDEEDAQWNKDTFSQYLLLTVSYAPGKTTQNIGDVLELSSSTSGEFLMYSARGENKWYNDTSGESTPVTEINLPITRVLPSVEWTLKYKRVPFVQLEAVLDLLRSSLGTLNEETIPAMFGAPKETVLFLGYSYSLSYSWRSEEPIVEVEVKMLEKRVVDEGGDTKGHNHFLNPKSGQWERILDKDGQNVYTLSDLNALLFGENPNPLPLP